MDPKDSSVSPLFKLDEQVKYEMKFLQFTYQHHFQIVTPRKWNEISYTKSRPFILDLEESRSIDVIASLKDNKCPNLVQADGENGKVSIKVVPELITRLITRGKEIGSSSPSNSVLCSTPELQKQYDQLVGSKEQLLLFLIISDKPSSSIQSGYSSPTQSAITEDLGLLVLEESEISDGGLRGRGIRRESRESRDRGRGRARAYK
ncbi:hypothetical protein CFP56_014315 [Quercus suber]|uniref:Uncharacterized protein n=1 Tax=Quercus suber TaxID=58331 RepID=A0AAW0KTV9_QUESU